MNSSRRALHFVLKISDRKKSFQFFRNVLGMKVLRHEEFEEGCKAACNGKYDGHWSKTMIGYGDESTNFVMELTYNYGIGSYELGNDVKGFTISSTNIYDQVKNSDWPFIDNEKYVETSSPDGHTFFIFPTVDDYKDPFRRVTLSSSNLIKTKNFWTQVCGLSGNEHDELLFKKFDNSLLFLCNQEQFQLEFVDIKSVVNHCTGFGRIAFSCDSNELRPLEKQANSFPDGKVLTPYINLETPGKADVQVVIIADPDGHEICFVGDEGFRLLSKIDKEANRILDESMENDKSLQWFEKKGIVKPKA